jgi:hypothetical protein
MASLARVPGLHPVVSVPVVLTLAGLAIVGCARPAVHLRHPGTGQAVTCGPYAAAGPIRSQTLGAQERACVEDYEKQGYQRVSDDKK